MMIKIANSLEWNGVSASSTENELIGESNLMGIDILKTLFKRLFSDNINILIILILYLLLVSIGCGGPTMALPPEQVMANAIIQKNKNNLQNQLLNQMAQSKAKDYTDYAVGPEDLLEVKFLGQDKLGREVRVNGKGEIALPLVGVVHVAELSPQKIESRLAQLYRERRYIKNPEITVFVKEYRHQKVTVTGAVNKPGSYDIIGPRTLLEMLGKAEGLKENAGSIVHIVREQSYSEVNKTIIRGGEQSRQDYPPGSDITEIDLKQLMTNRTKSLNVPIKNGDVIYVPFANNAYVLGAVNKPGNVPVKDNITATQAVAMAGGVNPILGTDKISIIRIKDGHRIKIPIDLGRVEAGENSDVPLKENDIVFVQESGFKKFLYNLRILNPIPTSAALPFY